MAGPSATSARTLPAGARPPTRGSSWKPSMSEERHPHLRAVTEEARSRKRRGPGPAVLMVFLYAGLFGAGLLWFRSRSPLFQRSRAEKAPAPAAPNAAPA